MLSSQTKDELTFAAVQKLKQHGLTYENIAATEETAIAQLIYPVGFWRVTRRRIIKPSGPLLFNIITLIHTEKSKLHQTNGHHLDGEVRGWRPRNRQRAVPAAWCRRKNGRPHRKHRMEEHNRDR